MSGKNELQDVRFSVAMRGEKYQSLINSTLQDPKVVQRFSASILSAVGVNPALQACTPHTILTGALLGESLKLSPSPQLGHYYLVPFKKNAKWKNGVMIEPEVTNAVFVLGYRGMIQLAIRSGNYKRINVLPIKKGEFESYDRLTETLKMTPIQDEFEWEAAETVGYYAEFEYTNGFKKSLYWSKEKMEAHADKYSAAFKLKVYRDIQAGKIHEDEMWKYSSYWYQDFDGMAMKTMLRQLLSKWGIMSVDMQMAYEADDHVISNNLAPEYIEPDEPPALPDSIEDTTESDTEKEPVDGATLSTGDGVLIAVDNSENITTEEW